MAMSFAGGTSVPAVGTAAYKQAQSSSGMGTYNPQSGTISQGVIAPSSTAGVSPVGANGGAISGPSMAPKTTVPVITSQLAQEDYNKKYQAYTDSLKNIQAQTDRIAQDKAIQDSLKVQDELHKSATNLEQQGLDIKKAEVEAKNQALKMASSTESPTPTTSTTPTTSNTPTGNITPSTPAPQTSAQTEQAGYNTAMNTVQDARTQALQQYQTQVSQIMNGTFPLSTEETALVNSVQQSLERQKASIVGAENMAAARGGQEYTTQQMVGNLANKVMNLDAMAAGTMANLKMGFMKQDYQMINDSYEKQQKYLDDKTQTIQKLHDAVLAQEKEQRDFQYKIKQDDIKNQLESDKFSWEQKKDIMDNAIKKGELSIKEANLALDKAKAGLDPNSKEAIQTKAKSEVLPIVGLIDSILNNPNLSAVTGMKTIGSWSIPFTDKTIGSLYGSPNVEVENQIKQLTSTLSLENRQKLKGSGAISDFEAKTLERAASAFSTGLSDEAAVRQLKQIQGALKSAAGLDVTVKIVNPKDNTYQLVSSKRDGINKAVEDGLLVEYQ